MDDNKDTIGLTELLDEVNRDLDELRKKHPNDYNIKNISMFWELERERVVARHSLQTVVKKIRRVHGMKRMMTWFFAGWITMIAVQATIRLVLG